MSRSFNIKFIISFLSIVLLLSGCGNKKKESFTPLPFPEVNIPAMIQSQDEAMAYMAEHLWDFITDPERSYPSDSLLCSGVRKSDIEQRYANWLGILDAVDYDLSEKVIKRLYLRTLSCERKDTSSNVFETFVALAEKYMYDPNSPMRNEEYFLHYASCLSEYDGFSVEERSRFAYQAGLCSLNRLGEKATDFRFADKNGKIRTLHEIKAPLTLLFFSNPGCEACMSIIEMLKSEQRVSEMISQGILAVLNMYIDEDIHAWRDYMPVYPDNWFNAFDPDLVIRTDNLYNVRAIPSLYLLDNEKRVILKDAPENKVMYYLMNL